MTMKLSTNLRLGRMFANILSIFVILAIAFPAVGGVFAQEPAPIIKISISNDYLRADDFTPNEDVTFTVYASQGSSEIVLEISRPADEMGHVFIDGWEHSADLVVDNYVVASDGINEKRLVLEHLTIEVFDPDTDFVSGTALPGRSVWVVVGNNTIGYPAGLSVEADEDGLWTADFAQVYDFSDDMWGSAEISDEDWDVTVYHKGPPPPPPNPHFTVFPEWEFFDGLEWPDGATVSITVAGKSECDTTKESWGYFFNGNFGEGCDIVFGDEVTFTDGDTVRTHTVRNLSVTKVDPDDDIVKGVADAGAEVYVWPHATGQEQLVTTNSNGKWNVDFTGIYDLAIGDGGRAEIRDETGNATAVDWYISQPRFTIFPDAQWFDGMNWPDEATVTITVKGKPECTLAMESGGGFFNGGFPEGCAVTVGDKVTFTDGTTTRKHTVQNLAIITVDKDTDIVSGIADTGADVHIWVWDLEGSNLEVIAMDGKWQADFGALGIDLAVGMGIQAEIRDESGNATSVDLPVPDPRIVASITEDWFYLVDFIPGSTLDLSIYENQGGSSVWHGERTTDVNGFAWIDAESWDLIPGNYLVVSDGNTTKDLVIEGFTFDVFDLTRGLLQGTAPGPERRLVWVGIGFENDGWSMEVFTDVDGNWVADFGSPVPNDYQWVAAQIFDNDGDSSELRPASQIIFLRPLCGDTYTVQTGSLLEIRYGSWVAIGEDLARQNAEYLTVNLLLNDESVSGVQQPVVSGSEIPCGAPPDDAYGVFYVTQVGPLSPGTYTARVTWILDEPVTDGYDADGDGEPDWYGPGELFTHEFTIIVG